jgi:hypothetical protein
MFNGVDLHCLTALEEFCWRDVMSVQGATADTFKYMLMGFSVILGVMSLFIISLIVRFRNLEKDLRVLQEIQAKRNNTE